MKFRVKYEKFLTKKKNGLSEYNHLEFDNELDALFWIETIKKLDKQKTLDNFVLEAA